MIPLGYLARQSTCDLVWLDVAHVRYIASLGSCIVGAFCDYIQFWRHNGYWLFNSASDIVEVAAENEIDLADNRFFYYEAYEREYDGEAKEWRPFGREESLVTEVVPPAQAELLGYDVVTYSGGNMPEHSPLSCNGLAQSIAVNEHCLLDACETAVALLEAGAFDHCEPGPFRIVAVYAVPAPQP